MKFFCTSGPVNSEDHYCLPLSTRLHEQELRLLIEQKKYFILHAPRQTGKTSAILNWVKTINSEGKYTALYINVEGGQAARGDFEKGMAIIIEEFLKRIKSQLPQEKYIIDYIFGILNPRNITGASLSSMLSEWASNSKKSLIIFIDEIDSLVGDTLISVLRQLRSGYPDRPQAFPQSVCLIGVRDVRDYRIWSDNKQEIVLGGSAFNIKAESIRLADFTKEQLRELYLQHTQATGQKFDDDAIDYAFEITQGQPWLVNALAYQACFKIETDRSKSITKEIIEEAKNILIKRRDTHIDALVDKLQEPRVARIIDAILNTETENIDASIDDLQYVRDLGFVAEGPDLKIANPIYQEIFPRELSYVVQSSIRQDTIWYQREDGTLDMHKLLLAFTQFYRENIGIWEERNKLLYKESGPHLLMMAFLQRVINGGGKIHREYALGRGRMDLAITWKTQRIVIEIKIDKGPKTLADGLRQTAKYMDTFAATEGHLVIFNRRADVSWEEKIYQRQEHGGTKDIFVWGL